MRWLRALWYRRQRRIDIEYLWPSCRDQAPDLMTAHVAFTVHALSDPAWVILGIDEIYRQVGDLT